MNKKEIFVHRLRDFDSVLRSRNRFRLFVFIVLRQIYKLLGKDEKRIGFLINNGLSKFRKHSFHTRGKTLDFLFFSKFYEPKTTNFLLQKRGGVFIDIGGHIGRFAILASDYYEKVHVFEPHPQNFEKLKLNVRTNHKKNIILHNLALSSKKEKLYMGNLEMNTGAAKTLEKGKFEVDVNTLDSFYKSKKIIPEEVSIIMIDAEGREKEVLEGGKEFLKKTNSSLIIESFNVKEIEGLLSKFGFSKVKVLDFYNHLFLKTRKFK
jgi:FkbM family methyltransferase